MDAVLLFLAAGRSRRCCCCRRRGGAALRARAATPLEWVTFGAVLVMAGWIVMSLGFGVYLREVADYNSIFGGLATVVVLSGYLYAAAVVFLGGVQVDALARRG